MSNGDKYSRESITKKYSEKLAVAQRAKKKKRISKINDKIKNVRKDWNHKVTTQIAKQFENVVVGDLSVIISDITNINKETYDSSLGMIKSFLQYKTGRFGGKCTIISEAYTTQTCSACLKLGGPKGKEGIKIRVWSCEHCGAVHDRDVNAAKNILLFSKHPELRPVPDADQDIDRQTGNPMP